ncbi:MAG: aspartyl protease family protein [Elusimicrobia bacterium]|nr:aspartyl protease family protein [Elusimicrobiota bacterium]
MIRAALLSVLLPSTAALADTLYLKNGNEMEGAISAERPGEVDIDIGYGTVTIPRENIERIKRERKGAGRGSLASRRFEAGRDVPESAAATDAAYREVRRLRDKALESRREASESQEAATEAHDDVSALKQRYHEASERLSRLDANVDPAAYNAAIADMNRASSQIQGTSFKLDEAQEKTKETNAALMEYMSAYRELERRLKGKAPKDAVEYWTWLKRETASMAKDFTKDSVAAERERHGGVFVRATVNGKATFKLMVDTGASVTVLYQNAIGALGLEGKEPLATAQLTVANGNKVTGRVFRADSIRIGKSVVRNTPFVVVPGPPPTGDGLLGMTFLSHFSVRVDGASGRLVLEGLK